MTKLISDNIAIISVADLAYIIFPLYFCFFNINSLLFILFSHNIPSVSIIHYIFADCNKDFIFFGCSFQSSIYPPIAADASESPVRAFMLSYSQPGKRRSIFPSFAETVNL